MNLHERDGISQVHFTLVFLTACAKDKIHLPYHRSTYEQDFSDGFPMSEIQATTAVAKPDGRTPLHLASIEGNLEIVKILVSLKPEGALRRDFIDKKAGDGATSLSLAVHNGQADVVRYLIGENADLGSLDHLVRLAVCNAKSGDKIVKILLSSIPESTRAYYVNAVEDKGNTAVHWACLRGNPESVKELLKAGGMVANVNKHGQTPLMAAVWSNKSDIVELITRNIGRVGALNYINRRQKDSEKAMQIAVRKGSLDGATNAVKPGVSSPPCITANTAVVEVTELSKVLAKIEETDFPETKIANCIHATDLEGNTALHWAAWKGNLRAVDLIFKAGGKLCHMNDKGETPLLIASSKGHLNVVQYLVNIIGTEGITKTHYVNMKRNNEDTALVLAVQEGHPDVARFLLDIAEVEHIDELLRFAAENNKSDAKVVEAVLSSIPDAARGDSVNAVDDDGNSALHLASLEGMVDAIDLLVNAGGKIYKANGEGKLPLVLAAMEGHEETVAFILDKYYEVKKCYDYQ